MIEPNPPMFFLQMLNFIILFVLLSRFVFNPLRAFLEERERKKREWLEAAARDRQENEVLRQNYRELLSNARKQAMDIKNDLVRQAQEEATAILEKAREEHQATLAAGKASLHQDVDLAKTMLLKEVDRLADEITRRLALR